ncbi:glycosyltransferase family 39 protein, partial [Candidatus Bathyarchaeota archaeon]|nr:glycosyltransferase family 39 protein [Candidatus Bathyarchaeota archaeon]
DEIYFVRTAENYLNFESPFSWSHPPLGKLIIASGISIFGYNPFGWRIMGAIFATLMIGLVFLIGKLLFESWIGAFASAFLFSFDFMNFSMGRMATTDVFLVFFSLVSQLFFFIYFKNVLKKGWKTSTLPLFLAILFFGFSFSIKWISLFGFLGQLTFLLFLRLNEVINLKEEGLNTKIIFFFKRPFFLVFGFLLIICFVYFFTYIPNILAGQSLEYVFNLQQSMFSYHSSLISTHPFASSWWSWPFMIKPVLLLRLYLPFDFKSLIVAMGNPAVWWIGFCFVFLTLERAIRGKDFSAIFITVLFFFQWLPYLFVSRTTYLYHFYVNIPMLCLASTYFINKYWKKNWTKVVIIVYFAIVCVIFYYFFPIISGMPQPTSFFDSLKWLESWTFY